MGGSHTPVDVLLLLAHRRSRRRCSVFPPFTRHQHHQHQCNPFYTLWTIDEYMCVYAALWPSTTNSNTHMHTTCQTYTHIPTYSGRRPTSCVQPMWMSRQNSKHVRCNLKGNEICMTMVVVAVVVVGLVFLQQQDVLFYTWEWEADVLWHRKDGVRK